MSTPPPVPPDMPEIPPVPGAAPVPPPVPGGSLPPVPPPYPTSPPPVSFPPVVSPQATPGSGTKALLFGCLALLVVVVLLVVAGGWWVGKKVKGFAENPEQAIAELAVSANPDLELVSVDKTTRQVVIRDKKSGETTTFSFEDIRNGKMVLKRSDGSSAEMGADGIRVKEKDGSESVIGGGTVALPQWVPVYPGSHTVLMSSRKKNPDGEQGTCVVITPDAIEGAAASYQKQLEAGGFTVEMSEAAIDPGKAITLEGSSTLPGGEKAKVSVRLVSPGAQTKVHLEYSSETAVE